MTCAVTPSSVSFTGIPEQDDPYSTLSITTLFYKNSVYDRAGNLLFSVNANGIYAANTTGSQIFSFEHLITTPTPCTYDPDAKVYTNAKNAISEIPIFPVPGKCHSYYMMFWSAMEDPTSGPFTSAEPLILRVIRIDIDPVAFGNSSVPVSSWYTITEHLMNEPDCDEPYRHMIASSSEHNAPGIVANKVNSDDSRDIYTLHVISGVDGGTPYNYTQIQNWHFPYDGGFAKHIVSCI